MAYSKVILGTHAFIPKAELRTPIESLRKTFTVTSSFDSNLQIETFLETDKFFGVPLHCADLTRHSRLIEDRRTIGTEARFSMRSGFRLRENQVGFIESFQRNVKKGKSGFLLTMPTGAGKTVLAIRMMADLGCPTLVIVPRRRLVDQWIDQLLQFTNLKREDIGIAQQNQCEYEDKKVVIGMIHSLSRDKYPEDFKKRFGCVIWDEIHTAATQTFSETVSMFPSHYRIGMSATMDRKDGLEEVYRHAIGEVLLVANDNSTLLRPEVHFLHYKANQKHDWINDISDVTHRRGKLFSLFAKDMKRNTLICKWAIKLLESGRRCVVFSDRVVQLETLRKMLENAEVPSCEVGVFTGTTKPAKRSAILSGSKIILATYGVMALGIDVPDLRAVLFATPSSDVAQPVGRILRICEGAKTPVVIDIVDTDYEDCERWAEYRQRYYTFTAKAVITIDEDNDTRLK